MSTSRDIQAKLTKENIYKNAVKLIQKKGFDNISVNEICDRADVSVGTFYYYFKSKENILFEIYKKSDNYFENTVYENLKSENSLEKVREYLFHYIKFVKSEGIDMVKKLYIPNNKLFIKKGRAMQTILEDIIAEGQQKNQISNRMTPKEAVRFSFVVMRGVVFDWAVNDGSYDIINYSESFIDSVCDYLSIKQEDC
ncbi:TetR family transcriptional regulator [Halanaerobium saccharolyticum]|uniref:TetR family transcriptional regulator n=1 Tax=Halanaerobium saccharolyticum TaxID=43595 RepID=A0A4R7YV46_9FIRM|nr:TetR/AcrR family transcriptional regulator [Halanaerobium saccharolyticum]RAK06957.1 TetR family transcriptional regulator [Halanaerobium saccharolyticum]TDW01684.1 TetR family transcriptional regulator [Halanaerobium saccharolyticum]TDX53082.1 TetR family transcriptional regulator [Halanaerobium saccharolyticum]